jgi:hypothetical protein
MLVFDLRAAGGKESSEIKEQAGGLLLLGPAEGVRLMHTLLYEMASRRRS